MSKRKSPPISHPPIDLPAMERCPGCDTEPGHNHLNGCDVERCAACGLQRIGCTCFCPVRLPWSGYWPGQQECEEYGFILRIVGGTYPDLNRLYSECSWDPNLRRWIKPS